MGQKCISRNTLNCNVLIYVDILTNINFNAADLSVAQWVGNLPTIQEMQANLSSIPGSGRSPGGGHGYPLQYSCLENPMDRGARWAAVHGITVSQT